MRKNKPQRGKKLLWTLAYTRMYTDTLHYLVIKADILRPKMQNRRSLRQQINVSYLLGFQAERGFENGNVEVKLLLTLSKDYSI